MHQKQDLKKAAKVPSASFGVFEGNMRRKGLRLNKKGAVDYILGYVAGLEKPASRVQSATKYEPGKKSLLLSGDLAFYIHCSRVIASGCSEHTPAPETHKL